MVNRGRVALAMWALGSGAGWSRQRGRGELTRRGSLKGHLRAFHRPAPGLPAPTLKCSTEDSQRAHKGKASGRLWQSPQAGSMDSSQGLMRLLSQFPEGAHVMQPSSL